MKNRDKYRPDLAEKRTVNRLPTQYDPVLHPLAVEYMLHAGMSTQQVADKLGIDNTTLTRWMHDYPALAQAVKNGRKPVDQTIINSLYKQGLGGQVYTTEKWGRVPPTAAEIMAAAKAGRPQPKAKWAKLQEIRTQHAPDTIAQIFWLKNRDPEHWRDRREVASTSKIEYTIIPPAIAGTLVVQSDPVPDSTRQIEDAHTEIVPSVDVVPTETEQDELDAEDTVDADHVDKVDKDKVITIDVTRGGLTRYMDKLVDDK